MPAAVLPPFPAPSAGAGWGGVPAALCWGLLLGEARESGLLTLSGFPHSRVNILSLYNLLYYYCYYFWSVRGAGEFLTNGPYRKMVSYLFLSSPKSPNWKLPEWAWKGKGEGGGFLASRERRAGRWESGNGVDI